MPLTRAPYQNVMTSSRYRFAAIFNDLGVAYFDSESDVKLYIFVDDVQLHTIASDTKRRI
jgi:hypothetical protein